MCNGDMVFDDLGINVKKDCSYRRYVCKNNSLNIGSFYSNKPLCRGEITQYGYLDKYSNFIVTDTEDTSYVKNCQSKPFDKIDEGEKVNKINKGR